MKVAVRPVGENVLKFIGQIRFALIYQAFSNLQPIDYKRLFECSVLNIESENHQGIRVESVFLCLRNFGQWLALC